MESYGFAGSRDREARLAPLARFSRVRTRKSPVRARFAAVWRRNLAEFAQNAPVFLLTLAAYFSTFGVAGAARAGGNPRSSVNLGVG